MIAAPTATPVASAEPTYGPNAVWARAVAAYALVLGVLGAAIAWLNQGSFSYLLDDAYIHLAISRDLAVHGTWGIAPGVYESASSAPLWTLVLAGITLVAGPLAVWAPLGLNVVAAGLLLHLLVRNQRLLDLGASLWDRLLPGAGSPHKADGAHAQELKKQPVDLPVQPARGRAGQLRRHESIAAATLA
jgi:hypothetical protein